MTARTVLGAALALAWLAGAGCFGALTIHDDDDDSAPVGDDDATWGDDPSDAPPYTGTVDPGAGERSWTCTDDGGGAGSHAFHARVSGWAFRCWIELTDGDTCEGYVDPATGEACEIDGVERPGWEMVRGPFGWSEDEGYWDTWSLELPFAGDGPPPAGASAFGCADGVSAALCCIDAYDGAQHACAPVER